ncbi:MAG: glycosyltransferase family 39 protein [Candidatus Melainabacteria bacterium]|nr:glycosyltransferase family 39 protein [Candidatus Melainabacteria bacterium]
MTASLRSEKLAPPIEANTSDAKQNNFLLPVVLGIAGGALALWCVFDHNMPSWDAAGHLLNGLSYQELFRHPHPFQLSWWHQLLTVNCFYPPLTYVIAGLVKTVVGTGLWTDSLMKVFYLTVLNVSAYGLVYKLTKDKLAAIFSVVVVNLYPEVTVESHKSMLDFAVMSMTTLALWALAAWQEKPDLKRSLGLAAATACALLTKQACAAFLLLPFAYYALLALKERRMKQFGLLVASGLAAGATLVPWLIVSAPTIKKVAAEIQVSLGNKQVSEVFVNNALSYFSFLPEMATPFLLLFGVAAIVFSSGHTHRQLALLPVSMVSGVLFLSTLTWQFALPRYFIPALLLFAAYSGCEIAALCRCHGPESEQRNIASILRPLLGRGLAALVLIGGVLGYVAINFYPFPLSTLPALDMIRTLALHPVSEKTKERFEHPCPDEDWGIMWALSKVKEIDGDKPVWLNVLPSTQQLNVHAFEYFGRQGKFKVHPTTSRSWSAAGDSSKFDAEETLHYQWYLIKNGEQGFRFNDPVSRANFDKLISFITAGNRFVFKGEKVMPDGSTLSLYRQK